MATDPGNPTGATPMALRDRVHAYMVAHPVGVYPPVKNLGFWRRVFTAIVLGLIVTKVLEHVHWDRRWIALAMVGALIVALAIGFCLWTRKHPSHKVDRTGEFMQVPIIWWWVGGSIYLVASAFASKPFLDWWAVVTGLIAGVMLLPWATEDEHGFGTTARRMGGFFIVATFSLQLLALSVGERDEHAKQSEQPVRYENFRDEVARDLGLDPSKVVQDSKGCLWSFEEGFRMALKPVPVKWKDGTNHQLCIDAGRTE